MDTTPIIALKNVQFAYSGSSILFENLNFELYHGQQIGIEGPNGCGKTTLLRLITGLEKPRSGQLFFHGEAVTNASQLQELRRSIGYILQNSDDQLFSPTVLEEVAFGPLNLGMTKSQARDRAMETLESLGISKLSECLTYKLSGGEKKLVAIASVLSMRPEALLLDEPTIFLDESAQQRITDILCKQTIARIVISHDKAFLKAVSQTQITMPKM